LIDEDISELQSDPESEAADRLSCLCSSYTSNCEYDLDDLGFEDENPEHAEY
jgi:hypothetical protein